MSNQVLLVVHQANSNPGLVGRVLEQKGYGLDIRCPAVGDALPVQMNDHAAAIVFGGPMSANDTDTLPFIQAELEWISTVLEAEKPFLGICLGAQLLARSLGATVAPHARSQVEIGYFPIRPTPEGEGFWGPLSHVYHWHREGFELPQDAVLLATGDTFPNQAFRYRHSAYGLQFHPEITADMITRWTTDAADQLTLEGAQPQLTQFEHHARYGQRVEAWLRHFLKEWLHSASYVVL